MRMSNSNVLQILLATLSRMVELHGVLCSLYTPRPYVVISCNVAILSCGTTTSLVSVLYTFDFGFVFRRQ